MKKIKKKEKQQIVDYQKQDLQLYEEYAKSRQIFQQYRGNHFTTNQLQSYKINYRTQQMIIRKMIPLPSVVMILLETSSDHLILLIYVGLIQLMIREVELEITRSSCSVC